MGLKKIIYAKLLAMLAQETMSPTMHEYESVANTPTTATLHPSPEPSHFDEQVIPFNDFAMSDYRLLESSVCSWSTTDEPTNTNLPLLREISSSQIFCRVLIDNYMILVVGSLSNTDSIKKEVYIRTRTKYKTATMYPADNIVSSAKNSLNVHELTNTAFFGSPVIAHSYDGNIGIFTADSTLNMNDVVKAFRYVLEIAEALKYKNASIVYTGDKSNKRVANLISVVNQKIPVFENLDDSFDYIRHNYFIENFPQLALNSRGCPIGKQSSIRNVRFNAFECTAKMAIHGISKSFRDREYGVKFKVTKTTSWFMLQVSVLRSNNTNAKFTMTFGEKGLTVRSDHYNRDIMSPIGIPLQDNVNATADINIEFPYEQFINSKPYYIRMKPEVSGIIGVGTHGLQVDVRKNGEDNFKSIGTLVMYGQLRDMQICGFASTKIDNVKSIFINSGLKTKPKGRILQRLV